MATPEPIETSLSNRAILIHLLEHVEAMWAEFERFRPLLDLIEARNGNGNGGQLDMIGVLQLRRDARKAARGRPGKET